MIQDIIRNDFTPPVLHDLAINTLATMEEYKISEIPIIDEDNHFLGTLEESIIMDMENINQSLYFVKSNLKKNFLFSNAHIFQSIQIFSENKISLIPVVNENNNYLGYLTPLAILNKIGLMHYSNPNLSIITLILNKKDYSLIEISRLVEENNGCIISIWSEKKDEKINLHLLIDCINYKLIIHTLERYNYDVNGVFSNSLTPPNLDDRFESFIKYLNT